ncbi:Transposase [Cordylochernes scorpioides]|uniref:Transposase n=1 Tax=Cordylochernes scorpioides TaxID=51811 RepID=A0ABY6KV62_9ARAC|nr:Transposase [Cordylochernes scorpioides]
MAISEPKSAHLREVLLFAFNWKKSATEAHRMLEKVHGDHALSKSQCYRWFKKFQSGDFELDNEPHGKPPQKFEDAELQALLDEDSTQMQEKLAKQLQVSQAIKMATSKAEGTELCLMRDTWMSRASCRQQLRHLELPGHRKRRQFKQTDAFTRGMVIGLKRAARVDRHILRQAVATPQATCTAILQHVQDTLDHSISTRTISRRLVANGLHSCRPLRRLPLTPPNRRQRLEWCRARSTWMTEWHRVVFSDESRFCLSSDSRRVRVWRRRGERSNPAAIVERPTVRQRGIMVWGAIAYDSRSPLLRIQGTMTAQRYVDDVLRPVTLPYLQGVPNALYQQDNARPHTALISQQALQDVQMLPWPPYSPDLSPIEHVWDIIGRRLHALPQPRSEDELWQMVEREWRAIPQDAIRTLIDSLPRRVAACIAVRGGPTCY